MNCPVPNEQLPLNEYKAIRQSCFYSLPLLNLQRYSTMLLCIWIILWILISPIVLESFPFLKFPFRYIIVSTTTTNIITHLLLIRIYLTWSYIGKRLVSATVAYEESGWYDGQMWIKPSELLIQDRLINSYEILPALSRVRKTLIFMSALLAIETFLYIKLKI
uniref:Ycf36 n=1 Tax=Sciadococcus taiwanensis TaxID=3028030 RepID=A0A9Y1I2A1_9RHOD|nr:hypothetical protein SCTW_173 [Sciadococcus taiwanensis]